MDPVEPLQVHREVRDVPFAARVCLASDTEASKAGHFFDPPNHGFDNRFPTAIAAATGLTRESRRHALRRLMRHAVALDDGRLATALVTHANMSDWPDFVKRYNDTVADTRDGRVDAVDAPIVISSPCALGIRAASPNDQRPTTND